MRASSRARSDARSINTARGSRCVGRVGRDTVAYTGSSTSGSRGSSPKSMVGVAVRVGRHDATPAASSEDCALAAGAAVAQRRPQRKNPLMSLEWSLKRDPAGNRELKHCV
jgi:hypothetical protein